MSQQALAEAMNELGFSWHQTTVAKTEAAERPLRLNEIAALATALSSSASQLIDGDNLVVHDLGDASGFEGQRLRNLIRARARLAELREEMQRHRDRIEVLSAERKKVDAELRLLQTQLRPERKK